MKFGYENEYFLRNIKGEITTYGVYEFPHDAAGTVVEVRSEAFENPYQVLASFNQKYAELDAAVKLKNCTLANLAEVSGVDTAGFHIHFSKPDWLGLDKRSQYNTPPIDVLNICNELDERFRDHFEGVKRHPHWWRGKPYGWEYRRLPATVDPTFITQVLADLFWDARKVAVRESLERLDKANRILIATRRAA